MVNIIYSNAFSEVLEILKYVSREEYEKIPLEIIEIMEDNCNKDYVVEYNPNISLEEQNISEEGRIIIAIFFRDYWATEKQREKILLKEKYDNDIEEIEKQKKFNPDNLFKNRKKEEVAISKETQTLVEYKEKNFIQMIFNKIKNIFKRS